MKWRGWPSSTNTWEPKAHLTEYGASESVAEWHATNPDRPDPQGLGHAIMLIQQKSDDEQAVDMLMRQHRLPGSVLAWTKAYQEELGVVLNRRCREVFGEEYERVVKNEKIVKLRMNPEPKKDGRCKMRLLVKGFMEPKEWDTIKDSPTALSSTVKTLVAMGLISPEDIDTNVISVGDISTAFLYSKEYAPDDRPRYVGYKAHKHAKLRIFQLLGPLYGQRDASHRWWETLSEWLQEIGFQRSENDKCAFYHPDPDKLIALSKQQGNVVLDLMHSLTKSLTQQSSTPHTSGFRLACHVDDIITRGHIAHTRAFWTLVKAKFALKSWDVVDYDNPLIYTGIKITKHRYGDGVWFSMDQSADIRDFLEQHNMWACKPQTAPMPYKHEIYSDTTPLSIQEHKTYRTLVGHLTWFTVTRYDIAYEVNRLAQHLQTPTKGSMKGVLRVMAYVRHTWDKALWVPRVEGDNWQVFSDSDHAGDGESGDLKSRTGVMIMLNGMPVFWRSNKQPKTSLSSACAEIYALSEACKDAKLRMSVHRDIGRHVSYPIKIQVDNAAGVSFQHSTCASSKLRGVFDMADKWVSELKDTKVVDSIKVDTTKNIADMMTKCLPHTVRKTLQNRIAEIAKSLALTPAK